MRLALLLVLLTACGTSGHAPGAPVDGGPCVVEAATATCARAGAVCGSLDLIDNCGATVRVNCDCPNDRHSGFVYSCTAGVCQQLADCRNQQGLADAGAWCAAQNAACGQLPGPGDAGEFCLPPFVDCGTCQSGDQCAGNGLGYWCCPPEHPGCWQTDGG